MTPEQLKETIEYAENRLRLGDALASHCLLLGVELQSALAEVKELKELQRQVSECQGNSWETAIKQAAECIESWACGPGLNDCYHWECSEDRAKAKEVRDLKRPKQFESTETKND